MPMYGAALTGSSIFRAPCSANSVEPTTTPGGPDTDVPMNLAWVTSPVGQNGRGLGLIQAPSAELPPALISRIDVDPFGANRSIRKSRRSRLWLDRATDTLRSDSAKSVTPHTS